MTETTPLAAPPYCHARRDLIAGGARVLTALALGLPLANCADNQQLGRSQLILVSDAEIEQMSAQAEQDIRSRVGVVRDSGRQRRIDTMAQRLSSVDGAPQPRQGFRAQLLQDDTVNAFVLPNGYSGYHDGMWRFCNGNDNELGLIMGHEMGHLTGKHAQERVSQALAINMGVQLLSQVAGRTAAPQYTPAIGAALGLGAQLGGSAFSRSHEHEADRLGLIYAARAGYDYRAGERFWDRMEQQMGSSGSVSFLSTHPSHGDRRQRLASLTSDDAEVRAAIAAGQRRRRA